MGLTAGQPFPSAIDLVVGETVTFRYTVTNTGQSNPDFVNVWDDGMGTTCVINQMAPGAVTRLPGHQDRHPRALVGEGLREWKAGR